MASFSPFLVRLYWEGNVYMKNELITCDEGTRMSSLVVHDVMSFERFLDAIYDTVRLSRDVHKLSLYLLYHYHGVDCVSEIVNDQTLGTLYFLGTTVSNYWGHIMIKSETVYRVQSPTHIQHFETFAVGATSTGGFCSQHHGYYQADQAVGTYMAGPSTYGHEYSYRQDDQPSLTQRQTESAATVAGFENLSEDCSSEHSEHDSDSVAPATTDDDDSDEEAVPETQPLPHIGSSSMAGSHQNNEELPEWADDEDLDMWSASAGVIRCGMYFKGKDELNQAVRLWNIARGREIIIVESTKHVYKAKCYSRHIASTCYPEDDQCSWIVRASKKKNTQLWQIYKWVEEHNCYGTVVRNNNRSLKSKVIASHIAHFVLQDVAYPVKHVQAHIKDVLHVDVSYQKAWQGRKKAIETQFGSWESNFEELPRYVMALQQSNPRTVVEWKHHDFVSQNSPQTAMFKYVFWAFGPSISAFQHCNPVLCVDGTHLKGSYKGKLLTAVTKDANNHVLPICYAIVDEETIESWSWFFRMFSLHVANPSGKKLCVISDRHQGIINALETLEEWQEPNAYHRYCLRHIRSNLMSRFKTFRMKKLCWTIGSTTQRRKYVASVRELKQINQEAWDYLKGIGTRNWTLLHDHRNRRWGNLTTNIAESMNNALKVARLLPIRACIDHTFNRTVDHFRKNGETAINCTTPLPPKMWRVFSLRQTHAVEHNVTEFNVVNDTYRVISKLTTNDTGGNDYTVHYKTKECTCGKWQMTRFPCSHAIAVCRFRGDNTSSIVHKVYKTSTYRTMYTCDFQPLPHKAYWTEAGWTLRGNASRMSRARGRRRARRIHNEMDVLYPEEPRVRRCTLCHQPGHRRTNCPNNQPSFD